MRSKGFDKAFSEKRAAINAMKNSDDSSKQDEESQHDSTDMLQHVKRLADKDDSDDFDEPVPVQRSDAKTDMQQHVKQLVEKDDSDDKYDKYYQVPAQPAAKMDMLQHVKHL